MRRGLGRTLQFLGLLILPFGMATELVGRVGEGGLLLIADGGGLLFYIGYVIQHRLIGGRGRRAGRSRGASICRWSRRDRPGNPSNSGRDTWFAFECVR